MKKYFILALAAALLLLTACGQTQTTTTTMTAPETEAEATTLKVWCIQSSTTTDYATNAQSLWMEEQTGIHIDYVDVPQTGWVDSFRNYVMSGETADIYLYDFDTSEITALSGMGGLMAMEDLIAEYAPNIQALLDENPEVASALRAPDGHIYSLFGRSYNQMEYSQKVYVNRDWLDMYQNATGNGLPQTTEELRAMLLYFRDNDMNGNGDANDEIPMLGVSGVDAVPYLLGSFVITNSGDGFGCTRNEAGEIEFAFNDPAFREGLAFIRELYTEGLYSADSFTIDSNSRFAYTSGSRNEARVGVVSGPFLSNAVQLTPEEDSLDYDSYVALPPVAGPEGVRTIVSRGSETIVMRGAISSTCADPVAAIKWLDFCYSEDARLYSVYNGLEGTDWHYEDGETINGNGQTVVADAAASDNHAWQGEHCITYRITEEDFQRMDASTIGSNSALATYRANLAYRPYTVNRDWPPIVWAGENQELADEYRNIYSAILETVTDYYTSVILGTKDLDGGWENYLAQLDEIGVARYIELCDLYMSQK